MSRAKAGPPSSEYDQARSYSGGATTSPSAPSIRSRSFRIEADSYLPAISRADQGRRESDLLRRELPAAGLDRGCVRLPDGSRWSGRGLVRGEAGSRVHREASPGRKDAASSRPARRRFVFPRQEPPFTIVVLHNRGFAERTVDGSRTRRMT